MPTRDTDATELVVELMALPDITDNDRAVMVGVKPQGIIVYVAMGAAATLLTDVRIARNDMSPVPVIRGPPSVYTFTWPYLRSPNCLEAGVGFRFPPHCTVRFRTGGWADGMCWPR